MNTAKFDPKSYLKRIGLANVINNDTSNLIRLVQAQGYAIPFENFDIALGRHISLEPEAIFNKLVLSQRGGYCFELNNLLLSALRHFGFQASEILARVHLRGAPTSRTHQLLRVNINGNIWLADVGFGGGGLLEPIPFELDREFEQDGNVFRLREDETFNYMLQQLKNDQWQNIYSFDFTHVGQADIDAGHYYTSTHPECFFTYCRIATIPIPAGRISLMNHRLRITKNNEESIITLNPGQDYLLALKTHFNIDLQADYKDLKPL